MSRRIHLLRLLGAVALLPMATAAQQAVGCHSGHFDFVRGGRTELEGQTSRNTVCVLNYGERSDITSYSVVQKPAHGTLGSAGRENGRFLTAYQPNPDYAGGDEFAVRIDFVPRNQRQSFSTIVHMRVRVGP
jgi:hypothetical protein